MYIRLHEGCDQHSYCELLRTKQEVSSRDIVGLFEFWNNLFVECGHLAYAVSHFRELGEFDENSFVELSSLGVYYGPPSVSDASISGTFEADIDAPAPKFTPTLELLGNSDPNPGAHPKFYAHVDNKVSPLGDPIANVDVRPRIEIDGSVEQLCRFHERVEELICAKAPSHASEFRSIGDMARTASLNCNWGELYDVSRL